MKPIDRKLVMELAKQRLAASETGWQSARFQKTIATFGWLGILRSNDIAPRMPDQKDMLAIEDVIFAAKLEPRIYELLPAVIAQVPQVIDGATDRLPKDLEKVLIAIRTKGDLPTYHGIAPEKYAAWLEDTPGFRLARIRLEHWLNHHKAPRKAFHRKTRLGEGVRRARLEKGLTQKELADLYDIPIRGIRDLEQGHHGVALGTTMKILAALGQNSLKIV